MRGLHPDHRRTASPTDNGRPGDILRLQSEFLSDAGVTEAEHRQFEMREWAVGTVPEARCGNGVELGVRALARDRRRNTRTDLPPEKRRAGPCEQERLK